MNKSFAIGFAAMDSIIAGVSATKRSIVNAVKTTALGAQVSVQATKNGALGTAEAVAGFFAGMKHAAKIHTGKCKLIEREGEK